jgi:hypothetical protein
MSPEQVPPIWPQAPLPDAFEVLSAWAEAEAGAVAEATAATVEAMFGAIGTGVELISSKGYVVLIRLSACFLTAEEVCREAGAEAVVTIEATTGDGIVYVEVVVGAMYATFGAGGELVPDEIDGRDVVLEIGGTSTDPRACVLSACFWIIEEVGACEACPVTQTVIVTSTVRTQLSLTTSFFFNGEVVTRVKNAAKTPMLMNFISAKHCS